MKLYLFICSPTFGEADKVLSSLRSVDSICDIRSPFPNLYFIKSSDTATTLSKKIIFLKPGKRFFISEVSSNRQGWLPKDNWDFIKEVNK